LPLDYHIISVSLGKTAAYKAQFLNPILQLHTAHSLLERWINALKTMDWETAWSYAYDTYYFGEESTYKQLPKTGILLITPDMSQTEIHLAQAWSSSDPTHRKLCNMLPAQQYRAPLIRCDRLSRELDFLGQHPNAIHFTQNPTLQVRPAAYLTWNIPEQALYSIETMGLSFCAILERLAPARDEVYDAMRQLGEIGLQSKYFAPALRTVLRALYQADRTNYYAAFVSDKPVILCGFDSGDWPARKSRAGALLAGLLCSDGVVATRADGGYGAYPWHSWGVGLQTLRWKPLVRTWWDFFKECFGDPGLIGCAYPLLLEWWSGRWEVRMTRALQRVPLEQWVPTSLHALAVRIYDPEKYVMRYVLRLQRADPVYSYVARALREEATTDLILNFTQKTRALTILRDLRLGLDALKSRLQPIQIYNDTRWVAQVGASQLYARVEYVYQLPDRLVLVYCHLGGRDLSGWVAWLGAYGRCTNYDLPQLPRETFVCDVRTYKAVKPRDPTKHLERSTRHNN
jgi:hypothetical protein